MGLPIDQLRLEEIPAIVPAQAASVRALVARKVPELYERRLVLELLGLDEDDLLDVARASGVAE